MKNIAPSVRARLTNHARSLRVALPYLIERFAMGRILWRLIQHMSFDRAVLSGAIAATFARRGTELPEEAPLALTSESVSDPGKNTQWKAFLRKGKLEAPTFPEIIPRLAGFLMPVIDFAI